jgi:hypothetical protein
MTWQPNESRNSSHPPSFRVVNILTNASYPPVRFICISHQEELYNQRAHPFTMSVHTDLDTKSVHTDSLSAFTPTVAGWGQALFTSCFQFRKSFLEKMCLTPCFASQFHSRRSFSPRICLAPCFSSRFHSRQSFFECMSLTPLLLGIPRTIYSRRKRLRS